MCAVIGAVLNLFDERMQSEAFHNFKTIWKKSHERGRDGRGYAVSSWNLGQYYRRELREVTTDTLDAPRARESDMGRVTILANLRAEPTTEYVKDKSKHDQQPYRLQGWSIVHNGTIANDKELRTHELITEIDSAAIVEALAPLPGTYEAFRTVVKTLKGSFAILATHSDAPGQMFVAANYRPVWYAVTQEGVFFASARHYFPSHMTPVMLTPYTVARFDAHGIARLNPLLDIPRREHALVVCSGGLDSVVSAVYAQKVLGMSVHLIHFLYGSRAEGPEVEAVKAVAAEIGAQCILFPLPVYTKGDSPLLDPDCKVAGGEQGAEFAHEWVPARNLLLLSVATAYAEARGIGTIVLGNNLEEAGAYPDNEPEFIAKFNDLLPFAVADGKQLEVVMPVGNLMKHEIVALGHKLGAPLHLTWSCYRAGEVHCGTCGPCYMRRKAFEINNLPEVITYKDTQ
jgi:7-cyano-7-deazaguanine synthase